MVLSLNKILNTIIEEEICPIFRRNIDDDWKSNLHSIPRGYNMSSTPLNDCIMAAMKLVPAFQKKYNIDKMNTVFLTDGWSDGNDRKYN